MTDEKNAENNELRLKLSQIKEYLKKSNEFKPNLEFDKEDFGRLNLLS
jgi:hypothetical protein